MSQCIRDAYEKHKLDMCKSDEHGLQRFGTYKGEMMDDDDIEE